MMTTNQEFKNAALAALKGNWAPAIIATIVLFVVSIAFGTAQYIADPMTQASLYMGISLGTSLLAIFVTLPLSVGYYDACRRLYVEGDSEMFSNMIGGFSNYLHTLGTMLLTSLFILLWTLLFIIPGIVMSYAYILVPFILKDEPELSAMETIRKSRAMMKGHKFDIFWLELSFIGWGILSILTLGIGLFWLIPYMYTSIAAFYEDLKGGESVAAA